MIVRRAEERDIPKILDMLVQVLNIHAEGRPDLFIPNTTKYTIDELKVMIRDDNAPIFVADEDGEVLGYAFTLMQRRLHNNNMTDIKTLFIDDLCVDENARGKHVGRTIFDHVKEYARSENVYHITLNVWSFNDKAISFYENVGLRPMETVMELILDEQK